MAEDESQNILTADERKILAAIADRIFPRTETPGAVEIGALQYIEVALAGDYAALAPLYRKGLRAVERSAKASFGHAFCLLSEAQKDEVLLNFETGAVPGFKLAAEFFETARCHVLEGVFCEPQYGGNRDMIGWRLVNFPGQQFGYDHAYINKRVDLEPVAVESPRLAGK
ncbi:MAG TPA: gluconate 2-dehydrogenase subunit 3 family protein [Candidatus Binatia bacterium]